MNVSLSPELERLVEEKVRSGAYPSASDVVREGLRLLQERDEHRSAQLEDLRREIRIGIDAADRGDLVDGPEFFARLREELTRGGNTGVAE
ncbi:MAG TPA: type II toxin-antitoxin system ParD family antitoxin [Armatimonadota bacterium]|jgi:antitoxin ParD1/3/4|nr:type II toxin-antitoxin system ParD family antitoxin [Armatimonadota bacterium]